MRANGAYTCLVSGGFTLFTSRIAAMIGFDEDRANTLLVDAGGRFAGLVAEPILGREAKLRTLQRASTARLDLAQEDTLAVGDGANDIPMIEAAGLGVAYHGKPAVAAAAAARIDHGDLTALLYAQGYSRAEFVAASMKKGGLRAALSHSRSRRDHSIGSATNSMSPSAVATSSSAVFLPAFFSASTLFCTSPGSRHLLLLDRDDGAAGGEPLVGRDRAGIDAGDHHALHRVLDLVLLAQVVAHAGKLQAERLLHHRLLLGLGRLGRGLDRLLGVLEAAELDGLLLFLALADDDRPRRPCRPACRRRCAAGRASP